MRLVHEGGVEGADLAFVSAGCCGDVLGGFLEQLVDVGFHPVGHFEPPRHGRPVGGDQRAGEIGAVGILEEVVAGLGRVVERGEIEAQRRVKRRRFAAGAAEATSSEVASSKRYFIIDPQFRTCEQISASSLAATSRRANPEFDQSANGAPRLFPCLRWRL